METNTELLNRIEAHIKGRLAVAESRAASSEIDSNGNERRRFVHAYAITNTSAK